VRESQVLRAAALADLRESPESRARGCRVVAPSASAGTAWSALHAEAIARESRSCAEDHGKPLCTDSAKVEPKPARGRRDADTPHDARERTEA
jgi:hypothetical protein